MRTHRSGRRRAGCQRLHAWSPDARLGPEGSFQSQQLQDEGEASHQGDRVGPFALLSLSVEYSRHLESLLLPETLHQGGLLG